MANIADTNRRCSAQITNSIADEDLENCHDSSDNVLRNPKYLASLRTLPNRVLSNSAIGFVRVSNNAASRVRIFHRTGGKWEYVDPEYQFQAKDLRAGLELGVDARDIRRPGGWDGRAKVQFLVLDGAAVATDEVALRVAPVLTHHHGQLIEQLLTQSSNLSGYVTNAPPSNVPKGFRNDPRQQMFVQTLGDRILETGVAVDLLLLNDPGNQTDIWVQDYFEPGYMSIPGPEGVVGLRIMIRSAQDWRSAGRLPFQYLRSDNTGAVQYLADGNGIDSMGNLETIPPHTHNGTSYPAGRIIMGSHFGVEPHIVKLLRAQEEQDPIIIDTSWLYVGHTDEFLQFLPADNARGWVMMVSDPRMGLGLLEAAQKIGHGGAAAMSRPRLLGDDSGCVPTHTIDQVLSRTNFRDYQEFCAQKIEENIATIKQATGISDEHIIRVPELFYDDLKPFVENTCELKLGGEAPEKRESYEQSQTLPGTQQPLLNSFNHLDVRQAGNPPGSRGLERRHFDVSTLKQVSAFYPGAVNSIVLAERNVVAPNPWGPVVDGRDVLATAVSEAYLRVNFTVMFIDDWLTHHLGTGEVHCGSNALRDMSDKWW